MAPRPQSTVLPEARGAPSAPQGGLGPPPEPPGSPSPSSELGPRPSGRNAEFSFNSEYYKAVRSRASSSRLLLHRSLPPPIRVSGEWVTEGGRSHTS